MEGEGGREVEKEGVGEREGKRGGKVMGEISYDLIMNNHPSILNKAAKSVIFMFRHIEW